ncbi:MAG: phosphomannose isomerase type II C-terminal cupin domain [Candidatus Omnitrophota bacterium]|jgi:mannose-1-phosphate guanylyltransferase/mannose-6-phosphate isomerase
MRRVIKKWGWYKVLAKGNGFKVKLLYLKPFGQTSLQRHKHRREIWVFLGSQKVKIVEKLKWHRLNNPGKNGLKLIEVQTGICHERDIERQRE